MWRIVCHIDSAICTLSKLCEVSAEAVPGGSSFQAPRNIGLTRISQSTTRLKLEWNISTRHVYMN